MPSNILNTDIMFPQFREGQSSEQKLNDVLNYLFMLREQLRYSLANLGVENINPSSLDEIGEIITEPVYVQLSDAEGNITSLTAEVGLLSSRLTDTEGNVSSMVQTTTSLSARVTDAEGNIGSLQLTSQSLQASVSALNGSVTSLTATINGLTLSVTNGSESSVLRLMSGTAQLSSANITFSGMVTFTDLANTGTGTVINGGNVSTGEISAISISACTIDGSTVSGSTFQTLLNSYGNVGGEIEMYYLAISPQYLAGGLRLDNQGAGTSASSRYRLFLYTNSVAGVPFALKIDAAGDLSLEAGGSIFFSAPTAITIGSAGQTINLVGTVNVNGSPIS